MRSRNIASKIFAGIDNVIFDTRHFGPSHEDMINICHFFSLGDLKFFEKEKGITVSHSNHLVFLRTTTGEYIVKFYPPDSGSLLALEYAINRYLIKHDFLTPRMYAGKAGRPALDINGWLATCYTYIDGNPAWQHINDRSTVREINAAMLTLKNILLTAKKHLTLMKQENFTMIATAAAKASRAANDYKHKKLLETSLQNACRTFQNHQRLFTRQYLHNNPSLTNFLISGKTVYTLDLSHIREDYILSDLAALVISCLFLDTPLKNIKIIINDYFLQHEIKPQHILIFNTLVQMGLIREYLKNVRREHSQDLLHCPPDTAKAYLIHLKARKKLIIENLKKLGGRDFLFG